ncbi:uncharacterized protein J3D65DRAFT_610294 [Phyllosticta citribraziliensis]|uniref:Uncharacterized protein n=1 Tax=Phyllosticta citribraziliensis TaxID=989973 RepID=A0ABR1MB24_9PEZI
MHVFTVAAALVSIFSLSAAAPTIEKRQDVDTEAGQVTICTGANNSGDCSTKTYKSNECNILPAPYYQNVLTFAPGHQILCRVTNSQDSCTTHGDLFIQYPGSTQFDNYNGINYSNMTSFLCQKCTNCP